MACGSVVAVGDGDEVRIGMLLGSCAKRNEGFFGEGTAAVAEEGDDCGFVVRTRECESIGN